MIDQRPERGVAPTVELRMDPVDAAGKPWNGTAWRVVGLDKGHLWRPRLSWAPVISGGTMRYPSAPVWAWSLECIAPGWFWCLRCMGLVSSQGRWSSFPRRTQPQQRD